MLTSTALVLMMTIPGLALFYGGMVRKKNVLATVVQSFATTCLVTVLWMIIGYSLAFTTNGSESLNSLDRRHVQYFMLKPMKIDAVSRSRAPSLNRSFMCFQMTFAIITPALICGALRRPHEVLGLHGAFMGLWLILVYARSRIGSGAAASSAASGALDFAGGTVVHINAGVAGLVCALVLGKRNGLGKENMAPYNLVYCRDRRLAAVGRLVRLQRRFGRCRRRPRRHGHGRDADRHGRGGAWLDVRRMDVAKKPSVLGIISGAVAGLVAITPASGFVDPTGALIIGIAAGVVCFFAAVHVKKTLGYDDSLDAFGVHAVGGIIGALLTGVFARAPSTARRQGLAARRQCVTRCWSSSRMSPATFMWTARSSPSSSSSHRRHHRLPGRARPSKSKASTSTCTARWCSKSIPRASQEDKNVVTSEL